MKLKRILLTTLAVLSLGVGVVGMTSCGGGSPSASSNPQTSGNSSAHQNNSAHKPNSGNPTNSSNSHKHTYEKTITAPTCTQQGYTTYTCSCGKSYESDYVGKIEHSYQNGVCSNCEDSQLSYTLNNDGKSYSITGIGSYKGTELKILSTYKGLPVTMVGEKAFFTCPGLTSVVIPDSVTSIGDAAFHSCTSLTSVEMGEGVTSIGAAAFYGCTSLKNMELGNGVTFVGNSAFSGCTSLTYTTEGDFKYLGNNTNPYIYLVSATSTNIVQASIHKDCKIIGESVFDNCTSLRLVEIPDGVVSIGKKAFFGCKWLYSIELPDGLISIGDSAFYDCADITSVEFPDSVTSVGEMAFGSCDSLTSVKISNNLKVISNSMFSGCYGLTNVVISKDVTSIDYSAFSGCTGLMSVYYKGTAEEWAKISINTSGNSYLTNATRYYYSETEPATDGNYWHYGENGEVVIWMKELA